MWSRAIAPYEVLLTCLDMDDPNVKAQARRLYEDLKKAGLEILFDDRTESPGVKFKDADLIGIPLRITVGARSLAKGEVELKLRNSKTPSVVPLDQTVAAAHRLLAQYSLQ